MRTFRIVVIASTVLALVMIADAVIRHNIDKYFGYESQPEVVVEEDVEISVIVPENTLHNLADEKVEMPVEQPVVYEETGTDSADDAPDSNEPEAVEPEAMQKQSTELAYTAEELEILALVVYQEAGADACSDDTRKKVGSVFLNRVNSEYFPDTFLEVATAERQYGLLHWTGIKWPDRSNTESEAHAVERAYAIAEELLTTGSVLPQNVIWQAEFVQGDGIYCEQDGFYFCYSGVIE